MVKLPIFLELEEGKQDSYVTTDIGNTVKKYLPTGILIRPSELELIEPNGVELRIERAGSIRQHVDYWVTYSMLIDKSIRLAQAKNAEYVAFIDQRDIGLIKLKNILGYTTALGRANLNVYKATAYFLRKSPQT